jgi:FMN phosphatase YigB (HAD superfamily)
VNAFLNDIKLKDIKYIGFDMDGTLYDEFDFIIQPYKKISELFYLNDAAYSYMLFKWLEKGSSYNRIFDETYELYKLKEHLDKHKFIEEALDIYRNFQPSLSLTPRVTQLLEYFYKTHTFFLVSDGHEKLQKAKFKALKLEKYFEMKNVIFTGRYSKDYYKPNIKCVELLEIDVKKTIFFGDRLVDEQFSNCADMKFKKVYNMIEVG